MFNKKGFFVAELMIVGSIIAVAIVVLYSQTSNTLNNYNARLVYNTVDGLYALNNIKILIREGNASLIEEALKDKEYVDLLAMNCSYANNVNYCTKLLESLKIKKLIFTYYGALYDKNGNIDNSTINITNLKLFNYSNDFDLALKEFINNLTIVESSDYRLIIYLEDGSISTIKFRK